MDDWMQVKNAAFWKAQADSFAVLAQRGKYIPLWRPWRYYVARKDSYTVPALLRSWGRPSPLHTADRKGSALPPAPYREEWAATPPRALPRTVRFRLECRLLCAPHSMAVHNGLPGSRLSGVMAVNSSTLLQKREEV